MHLKCNLWNYHLVISVLRPIELNFKPKSCARYLTEMKDRKKHEMTVCFFFLLCFRVWLSVDPCEIKLIRMKRMIYSALYFKYMDSSVEYDRNFTIIKASNKTFYFSILKRAKWYLFRAMIAFWVVAKGNKKNFVILDLNLVTKIL